MQDASWKDGPATATQAHLPCTPADEPANFTLYSAGPRLSTETDELALSAILRRCDKPYPGEPIRANSVSLLYGTCEVPRDPQTGLADGGCAPPLEIQTSPACERTLGDVGGLEAVKLRERRGVPISASGGQVELYSGDSTIVIHARRDLARRAVAALAPVPAATPPADIASAPAGSATDALPPPWPGVLRDGVDCDE